MKKQIVAIFKAFFILNLLMFASSCSNTEYDTAKPNEGIDLSRSEDINSFSLLNLKEMKAILEEQGLDLSTVDLENLEEGDNVTETRGIFIPNPCVKAIKVTTKTLHPDRSGRYIDVSGVLLVPQSTFLTRLVNYRIAIVPPPTYTDNKAAPSNAFKRMSLVQKDQSLNFLYFWTLKAQSGYLIFIPDYPGFGDSFGQCMHPYLDSKMLVNSTLDLFKVATKTLTENGYHYKKDIVVTGYSQGAFVASSLVREIETNPARNLSVNLLVSGGTPCDLKYIADAVRNSDYVQHTYFLPYGLWGYKENGYPNVNIADFLQEPYASTSRAFYDGTHADINSYFSPVPSEVYTEKFIKNLDTDPNLAYMNQILDENSVKPWKNKCKFVMTHGVSDVSVYYQNAKNFANEQNKVGKVTFHDTPGDHTVAFIPYFAEASSYLPLYQ